MSKDNANTPKTDQPTEKPDRARSSDNLSSAPDSVELRNTSSDQRQQALQANPDKHSGSAGGDDDSVTIVAVRTDGSSSVIGSRKTGGRETDDRKPVMRTAENEGTSSLPTFDFLSQKANEIMEAAGNLQVPNADQIAIGGKVYQKTDVIGQGGSGDNSIYQQQQRALEARERMQQLKDLNEKIEKGPTLQFVGKVSDNYRKLINNWWDKVPESIKQDMQKKHIHVVAAENTDAIYKHADKLLARGHHGDSIATTGGMFAPEIHSVVMVEHPGTSANEQRTNEMLKQHGSEKRGVTQIEVDRKAWHELGHALDYDSLKHIALSPEYDAAFKKGVNQLTDRERKNWDYFLSRDPNEHRPGHLDDKPKEEMLAELFMLAHMPKHLLYGTELDMLKKFEPVVDLLRSKGIMPPQEESTQAALEQKPEA